MSFFAKRNRNDLSQEGVEPPYHPIWSNFSFLLVTNFKLIVFFLPSFICLYFFLMVGGLAFLAGALLFLLPLGPAVAAMYDQGYQLVRRIPPYERRGFFHSYRANFGQGVASMAVQLPPAAILLLLMLTETEKPLWITLCLILGSLALMSFSILTFSQVALVPLSLRHIWKNSLMLVPLAGWRGILTALVQILCLVVLYQWIAAAFLAFLFLGPALLITWTSRILWPALEKLLIHGQED